MQPTEFSALLDAALGVRTAKLWGKVPTFQLKLLDYLFQRGELSDFGAAYEDITRDLLHASRLEPQHRRLIHAHVSRINRKFQQYFAQPENIERPFRLSLVTVPGYGLRLRFSSPYTETALAKAIVYNEKTLQMRYLNSAGDYSHLGRLKVTNRANFAVSQLPPEEMGFFTPIAPPEIDAVVTEPGGFTIIPVVEQEDRELRWQLSKVTLRVFRCSFRLDPPLEVNGTLTFEYSFQTRNSELAAFTNRDGSRAGDHILNLIGQMNLTCIGPEGFRFARVDQKYFGLVYAPNGEFDESLTTLFGQPELAEEETQLNWSVLRPLLFHRYVLWFRLEPR